MNDHADPNADSHFDTVVLPRRSTRCRSLGPMLLPLVIVAVYSALLPAGGTGTRVLLVVSGIATAGAVTVTMRKIAVLEPNSLRERTLFSTRGWSWSDVRAATFAPSSAGIGLRLEFETVDRVGIVTVVSVSATWEEIDRAVALLRARRVPVTWDQRARGTRQQRRRARAVARRHDVIAGGPEMPTGGARFHPLLSWGVIGIGSALLLPLALRNDGDDGATTGTAPQPAVADVKDEDFDGVSTPTMQLDCETDLGEQVPFFDVHFLRAETVSGSRLVARRSGYDPSSSLNAVYDRWTVPRLVESGDFEWSGELDGGPLGSVWIRTSEHRLWFQCIVD